MLKQQADLEAGIEPEKKRSVAERYSLETLGPLIEQLNEGDEEKDQSTARKYIKYSF